MPVNSKMTAIADEIRILSGTSDAMGLDDMANALRDIPKNDTADLSVSGATVTVPSGYYATQATKSVSSATQATPSITINDSGLITATATQTAGYVTAGTKSSTHQLAFQSGTTITPKNFAQYAVTSGKYTTGDVIVLGDSDLLPSNIKKGVDIFGVTGTYEGSGGGGTSAEDSLVTGNITNYTNDRVTTIGSYAFYSCSSLTTVSFPVVATIGGSAFYNCTSLTTVSFPNVTSIGNSAFGNCARLTTANFPAAISTGAYTFRGCTSLTTANFPAAISTGAYAFHNCSRLTTVSFPVATIISNSTFAYCSNLTTVSFPVVATIGGSAFYNCTSLTTVSFPKVTHISAMAFANCSRLSQIYLTASSVCTLIASTVFSFTGIWSDKGSIFVPASLVPSYKKATNWAYFSNRIYGISVSGNEGGNSGGVGNPDEGVIPPDGPPEEDIT